MSGADLPEDVMKAVREILVGRRLAFNNESGPAVLIDGIARAILAEREKSAVEISRLTVAVEEAGARMRTIRDYPNGGKRATDDGYPLEIAYDEFAYRRMVDNYRDVARDFLNKREGRADG